MLPEHSEWSENIYLELICQNTAGPWAFSYNQASEHVETAQSSMDLHKVWSAFLTDHVTLEGQVLYPNNKPWSLPSSAVLTQRLVSQLSSQELPEPPMGKRLINLSHENSLSKELLQVIGHFRKLLSSEQYLLYKYDDMNLVPNTQVRR